MKNKISILISLLFSINCFAQDQLGVVSFMLDTSGYTFPVDTTPDIYRILMEEYTGHLCGNCPSADSVLYNNIQPLYGDTLITIGIHAGFFADVCPTALACPGNQPPGSFVTDFRTTEGNDWNNFFSISSSGLYPGGMINRKDYPSGNQGKTVSAWNSQIASIIHFTPKVKIRIHTEYNPTTRQLDVYTETKFISQLSGNYKLNVILTEDSIVSWQEHYNSVNIFDASYVEHNVMRGSINGSWGEQINTGPVTNAGTLVYKNYSDTLPLAWNKNQIHVVAFLYDDNTKEILNVTEDSNFNTATNIGEITSLNSFYIYPNPLISSSIIQINTQLYDPEIIIYDILGKEMKRDKLCGDRIELEKGSLNNGVYFVVLKVGERQFAQKLIVE